MFLDSELDILHILVMFLKNAADFIQLRVAIGQDIFHSRQIAWLVLGLVDRLRRASTSDHILTLGIDQIFTVKVVLASGRVTGKGNTGGAIVTHIAVDHRLYVDGSTPFCRDVIESAVGFCTKVHPGAENRTDGSP